MNLTFDPLISLIAHLSLIANYRPPRCPTGSAISESAIRRTLRKRKRRPTFTRPKRQPPRRRRNIISPPHIPRPPPIQTVKVSPQGHVTKYAALHSQSPHTYNPLMRGAY